jgi:hypothetical protein
MKTLKLGTQTASLQNHMLSTMTGTPEPKVGMKVTELCWTDRKVYTITKVDGKNVTLKSDLYGNSYDIVKYRENWCWISYDVIFLPEFLKSLDEFDFKAMHEAYVNGGGTYTENGMFIKDAVDGVTRIKKTYHKMNLVFGINDPHFDMSF